MNPLLQETATGRDWHLATDDQRRAFCAVVSPIHLDPDLIHRTLETLLRGSARSLGEMNLHALLAIVISAGRDVDGG